MNALEIPAKVVSPFIKFDPQGRLEIKANPVPGFSILVI